MSRRYAQFASSMWDRGSDFRTLTRSEQGTYTMLSSQRDISAVGLLKIPVSLWADYAADTTAEDVQRDLKGLAAKRFILVDDDELLIRTFMKWDLGYTNELRRKSIVRAAHDVQSPILRAVLAYELGRVGIAIEGFDTASDTASDERNAVSDASINESGYAQLESSFDTASYDTSMPSGVVGTYGDHFLATSHIPQPPTPQPLRPADDDELVLIAEIRRIRPGWSKPAVRNAISRSLDLGYTMPEIAAAFRIVADDPKTIKPGRLSAPGPWWDTVTTEPTVADSPTDVHDFDPSPDNPNVCVCKLPRRNWHHTGAI